MSLAALEIKGGYFLNTQEIHFFKKHRQVASIIYGKNGSGKSSITRAISENYKKALGEINESNTEFINIVFKELKAHPQQGTQPMDNSAISSIKTYVYNEDFILENIHFKDNGLDTIVMLGDQQDLHKKISDIEKSLEIKRDEYTNSLDEFNHLQNKTNPNSAAYFREAIREKLKDRWASTQSKIQNTKINAKVDINLINGLLNHEDTDDSYDFLLQQLNLQLNHLDKINTLKPFNQISPITLSTKITYINQLLQKTIKEPELNERENAILTIIQKSNGQFLNQSKTFMGNDASEECPFCYQLVPHEHRHTVVDVIKKILQSDAANEHINELEALNLEPITLNLSIYKTLIEKNILNSLKESLVIYNESIIQIQELITSKKNNPYTSIFNDINLSAHLNNLNENISVCNEIVKKFNDSLSEKDSLIQELSKINLNLAYKDVKELIKQYKEKKAYEKDLEKRIDSLKIEGKEIKRELEIFKSKITNVDIACNVINDYLKYIFYDSTRLTLHPNEGFYLVKCRGENVKLSSLSIGERNAISLCYFFSQLFKGKTIQEVFNDKSLLVIDDPISSFDFENKVGVYSFLRFVLNELHAANSESKAIIFTHDLESFQHFQKIYSDIGLKNETATNQLIDRTIKPIQNDRFNEYSILLQNIYDYAIDNEREILDLTIGNTMRRVLEAFSSFNYKMGIEELTTNESVLAHLPSQNLQDYFKNCMYRLVLHSESHFLERTKGLIDRGFIESFSISEKIKTAKDLLILLYTLNPLHIEIHLKKQEEDFFALQRKVEAIETWREELFPETQLVETLQPTI